MERRFGFRDIRPLEGAAGQERFGLLDLAGGGQAAVLGLQGRTGSPAPAAAIPGLLDRLADALPESPVQFLLSRRRVEPAGLLGPWRAGIAARLGETAAADRAWQDLQGVYLPRLDAAGLADVWCGVAVSAPDSEALAGRVAALFTTLPYDAAPLNADELSVLVGRLLRPGDPAGAARPFALGGGRLFDLPGLAPRALVIGTTAVTLTPGIVTSYWQITPPLPRAGDGPWHRLLEFPDLLPYSYDVAVHLGPAAAEGTMREVLDHRLARIEEELDRRGPASGTPPPPGASFDAVDTWLLELERREVAERRTGLQGGRDRLREAVVLLALHLPVEDADPGPAGRGPRISTQAAAFAQALRAAEILTRPLHGRALLGRAVRASLPLANAGGLRTFAVPARPAAELGLLPAPRPPARGTPALGLTPEKTLFTPPDPAGHRLLAGGDAPARRAAARQWALETYLAGADLLVWDPAGAWTAWVEALGGRYLRPGGPLPADRLDLLAAPLGVLNRPEVFDAWVRELAGLFGLLLPPLTGQDPDAVRSQLGAALLQIGMRSLERSDTTLLRLEALHAELRAGGYRAAADGVVQLAAGPAGGLFHPGETAAPPGILALGAPEELAARPGRLAVQIALRHALWRPPAPGAAAPARPRRVVLLDGVTEALKHAPLAADLLQMAAGPAAGSALWLLPGTAELPALLAHRAGQALLRPVPLTVLLSPAAGAQPGAPAPPPAAPLAALAALAGIPESLAALLPLLPPDRALVAAGGQTWVLELITGALAHA